jgi:hydroxymethylpyrimidine kinase/phosphomethylpyrimidine kinase/thiamine-phosphate diphosphorylase
MQTRPIVLNISGNDSAGCSGLTMDVRTQMAIGVHSASVITANTAQNNRQVLSINAVSGEVFADQLKANSQLPIKAIKVGLLAAQQQVELLANFASENSLPLVLDPVLGSTSGANFSDDELIEVLKNQLLPLCTLITPNIPELEKLTGLSITNNDDIVAASQALMSLGAKAVYIKGGHINDRHINQDCLIQEREWLNDYFSDGDKNFWLNQKRIDSLNKRGTGCLYASAVASALALDYSLYDAVVIASMSVNQALKNSYGFSLGDKEKIEKGPVLLTHLPNQQEHLPLLTTKPINHYERKAFPECNSPLLGLYPVVDRAEWINTLAPAGVTTMQLRIKDLQGQSLEDEIKFAIEFARQSNIRLFINDYWQLAIKHQAYGVHLGQEDLDTADIDSIYSEGLRLGISTHCHYEVARAHVYQPSYIACGPVYHTTTKDMPWVPHDLSGLKYWQQCLDYPLVAIGGINKARFANVAKMGVDSVAMITAITLADDPQQISKKFVEEFNHVRMPQ